MRLLSLLGSVALATATPLVKTSYGDLVGTESPYRPGVNVYRGIPYAKPPVGDLRFRAPEKPDNWTGTLNATVFGPQCIQPNTGSSIFTTGDSAQSEDCLYINVWTPENATAGDNLPVYLWMYGGRYYLGSGDVLTYDGSGLAQKDVIVVTFNYRLGVLGFFAHPELSAESGHNSSGNYGLLDAINALTWVHEEIAAFGGNPEHITVGGQSAGSCSALSMMWSPLTEGLGLKGVIAETGARSVHDPMTGGSSTSYRDKVGAETFGELFLEELNLTSVAELRAMNASDLSSYGYDNDIVYENTQFANLSAFMEPPEFRPVVDGYVLTHTYGDALRLNAHADVPILTGNNADESGADVDPGLTLAEFDEDFSAMFGNSSAAAFALYPADNASMADMQNNAIFRDLNRIGTWDWGKDYNAGGAQSNVYTYFWTHAAPTGSGGAFHGSELYYAFASIPYADTSANWTETDYEVMETMSTYWANFIKHSDPNGDGLAEWPANSADNHTCMWLGNQFQAGMLADPVERIDFFMDWFATQRQW
ncbi:hypothetical protein ASPZODRAFT_137432 [Penicilliopsis zonata CBS 506.65]|uniref:Carboxylic ester hydrolase n=1 Tax=Penicilliopsis zonata CBS 506.65 TaxID=1073090 RepID=A0A1L9S4X1_9EURO|nr:hypothetical protein ASPZODRAFT_137432 [Penicilliopsis zonata CBS 506.65]OJJ42202.1 hypothetical protein ASPZODRAFT_137432 [Penicilliopsis zonata CBS 506.65]